ncbi:glycosyltransferase [Microbacterium sp. cx-55]|uniref:glycosyltransferase n=1 Tax=Microbacterium sp. cx-55 TaxID=2875948 RepID=UPI001CBCACD9|nr:glycosyltransferase [Microbacterium sp. cx-55]MBZ4486909.1 glycosyltransferase [Microbacterium sp. cx-55]UGB35832.1 glycosyltransferase [Microbacterium sp. cx-55]
MTITSPAAPASTIVAPSAQATTGAFHRIGTVEVAVLIVTYNSAADLDALIADLRIEAADSRIRVIVADNASHDGTWDAAAAHRDVVALRTGGNHGYAGGLNIAMRAVGDAEAVLVLNPDLRVRAGAVSAMLARLRSHEAVGAVVPLIEQGDGSVYPSLRREPGVLRAAADGLFGRMWPARPAALSEYVRDPRRYRDAHSIDWATGAALLIRSSAAASVGSWDERFFLYSEETDFQRRLREDGWRIEFDPSAVVVHRGGGSGVSDDLVALTIVNRVRYMDKHAPARAGAFRAAIMAGEELRRDPSHARARWALRRRARWQQLPRAEGADGLGRTEAGATGAAGAAGHAGAEAEAAEVSVDHVLLTRFNLPTPGPESLVRARDGWLRERIDLFERYTIPSVDRQTVGGVPWIVYLDPQSPAWLLDRLRPYVDRGLFTPLYRDAVTWVDVAADARALTGASGDVLLTTNLDNDDALADDFVERLQRLARRHRHAVIYLTSGLIAHGDDLYLRRDRRNAFCSVVESWESPGTAWNDWHTLLPRHYPAVTEAGAPAWLQVVHGGNVSNRIRGTRVDPAAYRARFAPALPAVTPTRASLLADRCVGAPVRAARELVRATAKSVLLGVLGKDGWDRVKARLIRR